MKIKLLTAIFILSVRFLSGQTTLQWTDSIVVTATSLSVTAPRVQLLPDGTPLITWGTSGNPSRIWSSRFENNSFTVPVSMLQGSQPPNLFGFGGYDVAISDSLLFVVYENHDFGIFVARSEDKGDSFSPAVLIQGAVTGGHVTLSSVTIDGTGNPVVSYILDKNGAVFHVRRSIDGGLTFGDAVIANAPAPGGLVCECCTSSLLAAGDSIWMVYRNNNQSLRDIWVARSTDLAATFDVATDVDATDWYLNYCPIAGPRMARMGDSLVTVWMSATNGTGRVYLNTLHASTMQAGNQLDFPPIVPQNSQSQADITASGDTVGMVYMEKSKEIMFHYSTNGTADLQHQNTRFAVANHTLKYPSVTFRNGVFHLVYLDDTSDEVLYRRGNVTLNSPTNEPAKPIAISLFPNPTTGVTGVRNETGLIQDLTVMDVYGKRIYLNNKALLSTNYIEIDLKHQPFGVYFVNVKTSSGWWQGKLVKL